MTSSMPTDQLHDKPSHPRQYKARIAAIACLALILPTTPLQAQTSTPDEKIQALQQAKTPAQFEQALQQIDPDDPVLRYFPEFNPNSTDWSETRQDLVRLLQEQKRVHTPTPSQNPAQSEPLADPAATAREILQNPLFYDPPAPPEQESWLGEAFGNLGDAIEEFLERLFPPRQENEQSRLALLAPTGILTPIVWTVLAVALLAFVAFVLAKFKWASIAKKKAAATGLLDDDESERTADEWILRAQELAAQGKHREAVRALYLASLVRIDEAGIAHFVRSQTNWEHLQRIETSPLAPQNLNFRETTQRFDLVWYGYHTKGQPDVDWFLDQYQTLLKTLNNLKRNPPASPTGSPAENPEANS